MVRFEKGEDKEKTARPFLEVAAREGKDRVVLIGIAQEKASAWRSWKSKGQEKAAHPHMEWGRQMTYINHFYFYLWDSDWGAAFWKTNAYAPYPIWLWLNGHEWAKRQLEKARVGYEALDNGFRLQILPDQAVLQRGAGAAHRNRDLQYPGLRNRAPSLCEKLECPPGCWRIGQPALV